MIIYGSTLSPFVRKTVAFAREKSLDFEMVIGAGPDPDPGFLKASPLRKMPALADGDYTLADSSAIAHYLDAKYPDRPLIPVEPEARGKTVWWDEYADTVLCACGAKMFFNRVVAPIFMGRDGDEGIAARAEAEELPPILDFLEGQVPGGDSYFVGDSLTLADLAIASPMANLSHLGIEMDAKRHPRLAAWVANMLARPSFAQSVATERALLERMKG